MLSPVHLSSVCLLSVTLLHPTQTVVIFRNFIWHLVPCHPLTSTENFTEIVPGEPIHWGRINTREVANIAILDLSKAISRKRCKIGGKLVLITNRNLHMSFWLVPKLVTLNDLERCNGRYFTLFHRIRAQSRLATVIMHLRFKIYFW